MGNNAPAASGDGGSKSIRSLKSGLIAGFSSVLLLQPMDVVKTRLQELTSYSKPATGVTSGGRLWHVIATTYQVDGLRGFWRGTGILGNGIRIMPIFLTLW